MLYSLDRWLDGAFRWRLSPFLRRNHLLLHHSSGFVQLPQHVQEKRKALRCLFENTANLREERFFRDNCNIRAIKSTFIINGSQR